MIQLVGASLAVGLLGRTPTSRMTPNILPAPATHTGTGQQDGGTIRRRPEVRGLAMAAIIAGLVIFAAGAAVGVILLVSWGIRREERDFSLTRQAPDKTSRGARVITDLYVRQRSDAPTTPFRPDIYV